MKLSFLGKDEPKVPTEITGKSKMWYVDDVNALSYR